MTPNNNQAPRLTVRFPAPTIAQLVETFHGDVIDGGMLVRTRWGRLPLRVGSIVRLRFELGAGEEVLGGHAQIAAIRDADEAGVVGLALRFRGLTHSGQRVYAALLERARGRDFAPLARRPRGTSIALLSR